MNSNVLLTPNTCEFCVSMLVLSRIEFTQMENSGRSFSLQIQPYTA